MKRTIANITAILTACILLTGTLLAVPAGIAGAVPTEQAMQAVPSYVNPLTNQIEDTGSNPELGQGMTENFIMKTPATLLTDAEGSTFITIRIGLIKESQDVAFELLDSQGKASGAIPYSIVAEYPDDNKQDIRMKIPSQTSVLRFSLISIPMGREVVGFVHFVAEGEVATVPVAEGEEVDDSAISIYENAGNDEIVGASDEARDQILLFLGIAGGILLVIGAVATIVYLRKKKSGEPGESDKANESNEGV